MIVQMALFDIDFIVEYGFDLSVGIAIILHTWTGERVELDYRSCYPRELTSKPVQDWMRVYGAQN